MSLWYYCWSYTFYASTPIPFCSWSSHGWSIEPNSKELSSAGLSRRYKEISCLQITWLFSSLCSRLFSSLLLLLFSYFYFYLIFSLRHQAAQGCEVRSRASGALGPSRWGNTESMRKRIEIQDSRQIQREGERKLFYCSFASLFLRRNGFTPSSKRAECQTLRYSFHWNTLLFYLSDDKKVCGIRFDEPKEKVEALLTEYSKIPSVRGRETRREEKRREQRKRRREKRRKERRRREDRREQEEMRRAEMSRKEEEKRREKA